MKLGPLALISALSIILWCQSALCELVPVAETLVLNPKKDMVYLLIYPRSSFTPNQSPYSLKIETWMLFSGIKYRNIGNQYKVGSPPKLVPMMEWNGNQIPDSAEIIKWLGKEFPKEVKANMIKPCKDCKRNEDKILKLIETDISTIMMYDRSKGLSWMLDDAGMMDQLTGGLYSKHCKKLTSGQQWSKTDLEAIEDVTCKKILTEYKDAFAKRADYGKAMTIKQSGKSYEEYSKKFSSVAKSTFLVIETQLKEGEKFLFGQKPTEADASLFGHLIQFFETPLNVPELNEMLLDENKFPEIHKFVKMIKEEYWKNGNVPMWDYLKNIYFYLKGKKYNLLNWKDFGDEFPDFASTITTKEIELVEQKAAEHFEVKVVNGKEQLKLDLKKLQISAEMSEVLNKLVALANNKPKKNSIKHGKALIKIATDYLKNYLKYLASLESPKLERSYAKQVKTIVQNTLKTLKNKKSLTNQVRAFVRNTLNDYNDNQIQNTIRNIVSTDAAFCQPIRKIFTEKPSEIVNETTDIYGKLVSLINERLDLARDVAWYKKKPDEKINEFVQIDDLVREKVILDNVELPSASQISPDFARKFFQDQMDANKCIQRTYLGIWKDESKIPSGKAPDLPTVTRPKVSVYNGKLIEALNPLKESHNGKVSEETQCQKKLISGLETLIKGGKIKNDEADRPTALCKALARVCEL